MTSEVERLKRASANFSSKYTMNRDTSSAIDCEPCLPVRKKGLPRYHYPCISNVDRRVSNVRSYVPDITIIKTLNDTVSIIKSLKLAVINDFMHNQCTPAINTVKLANRLVKNIECNPYISTRQTRSGYPIKYFVYISPHCQLSNPVKYRYEIAKQEIAAIDENRVCHSVFELTNPETVYIVDTNHTYTYARALDDLHDLLIIAIKAIKEANENNKVCLTLCEKQPCSGRSYTSLCNSLCTPIKKIL